MDARFSPEQQALRDSVVHMAERLGPTTVGQLADGERTAKLHAAIDAAGWRDLRAADGDGMPWASGVEAAIVAEELSRGLMDTPFLGATLAAELRRLIGSEPSGGPETVALAPGLGALGTSIAIDAAGAGTALGLRDRDVVEVPVDAELDAVDLTRPSAAVGSASTHVAPASEHALARWTALGLALTAADLVGAMRGALDLAVGYAQERKQYGAPIGSFQAVQHMLADAHVAMEGARSIALHAAWAVDALDPTEALVAAAEAKAYCSRAARDVGETVIQVHGGIGNTWECLAHVYLRRALLSTDVLGGIAPSIDRVLAHHGIGADVGLQ